MGLIQQFLADKSGATMIEYGLIVALVSLIVAVSVGSMGVNLRALYDAIAGAPF